MSVNCNYFLIHQFKHVFWVLKRTVSLRRFFLVPTTYVWMRNEENCFPIHILSEGLKDLASLSTCMYPFFVNSEQQWRCALIIRIMSFFLTQIIILTPFCLFMTRLSPCSVFSIIPSLICALRRKPFDTWYCSTAFSLFPSACSSLNVAAGTRLNAPSSGANTVYGPRENQIIMLIPLINMRLNESYTKIISCIFHIILRFELFLPMAWAVIACNKLCYIVKRKTQPREEINERNNVNKILFLKTFKRNTLHCLQIFSKLSVILATGSHTSWLFSNTCPYYYALCKHLSILLGSLQTLVHTTMLFANTCPYYFALCKHLSILLCSLQTHVHTTLLNANPCPYYLALCKHLPYYYALCKHLSILLCSSQALIYTTWLFANTCPSYFALCKHLSILPCSSQALVHSTWLFANTCPYYFALCKHLFILFCSLQTLVHTTLLFAST